MTKRFIEINNPGQGSCAFYAFANGLIPILKKPQYEPLLTKLCDHLALTEDRNDIRRGILNYKLGQSDSVLLDMLDELLRYILCEAKINLFINNESRLSEEQKTLRYVIMADARQLFDAVHRCVDTDCFMKFRSANLDNQFIHDGASVKYICSLSEVVRNKEQQGEKLSNDEIDNYLYRMLFTNEGKTFEHPCDKSQIFFAAHAFFYQKSARTWGTSNDLSLFGDYFAVKVITYGNGNLSLASDAADEEDGMPVIRINHIDREHFTTFLNPFGDCNKLDISKRILDYQSHIFAYELTLAEIRSVLKTYLRFSFGQCFKNTRENKPFVCRVMQFMVSVEHSEDKVKQVMGYVKDNLLPEYAADSELRGMVDYLLYRFEGRAIDYALVVGRASFTKLHS